MKLAEISSGLLQRMKNGSIYVPATLMIDSNERFLEDWQRLQTLYWLESGASTVVPGAHTGQFALGNLELYYRWLDLTNDMIARHGDCSKAFYMAAASGPNTKKMAYRAAEKGYEVVF